MKLRSATTVLIITTAVLLTPAALSAQFTTFVAPPRKEANSPAKPSVVAVAKARADSASRMSVTEMKAWVDSAAGAKPPVLTVADTTMVNVDTASTSTSTTPTTPQRTTTSFSNGAIAPNTATPLPVLFAAGLASLIAGLVLFGLRRRRA